MLSYFRFLSPYPSRRIAMNKPSLAVYLLVALLLGILLTVGLELWFLS